MPNGARNIPQMPITMQSERRGMELKIPSKFSRSRLPSCCSAVPTVRKRRDLATAWKMTIMIAVHAAS